MKKIKYFKVNHYLTKLSSLKSYNILYLTISLVSYECNHSAFSTYDLNCSDNINNNKELYLEEHNIYTQELYTSISEDFTYEPNDINPGSNLDKLEREPNYEEASSYSFSEPNKPLLENEETDIDSDTETLLSTEYDDSANYESNLEELEPDQDNSTSMTDISELEMLSNVEDNTDTLSQFQEEDDDENRIENEQYNFSNQYNINDETYSIFSSENEDALEQEAEIISEFIDDIDTISNIEEPTTIAKFTGSRSTETDIEQEEISIFTDVTITDLTEIPIREEESYINQNEDEPSSNHMTETIEEEATSVRPRSTGRNRSRSPEYIPILQLPITPPQPNNRTTNPNRIINNALNPEETDIINSMSSITDRTNATNAIIKYPSRKEAILKSIGIRSIIYQNISTSVNMSHGRRSSAPTTSSFLTGKSRNTNQEHQSAIDEARKLETEFTRIINLLTSKATIDKEMLREIEALKGLHNGELLTKLSNIKKRFISK